MSTTDLSRTAVVVIDLQNDFLHPDGAYGRAGVSGDAIASLPEAVAPLLKEARRNDVPVVFCQFSLFPGRNGDPIISAHLQGLRPFLTQGDFLPGAWGHQSVEALGQPDQVINKVAYSGFANTRLDWWLSKLGITNLIVAGIVTNGGVASTVRAAHVLEYSVTVLSDGVAAFSDSAHQSTLESLATIVDVSTISDVIDSWSEAQPRSADEIAK